MKPNRDIQNTVKELLKSHGTLSPTELLNRTMIRASGVEKDVKDEIKKYFADKGSAPAENFLIGMMEIMAKIDEWELKKEVGHAIWHLIDEGYIVFDNEANVKLTDQ